MDLVGFLVVVLWALPMLLSMGADNDHESTLAGTIFSNAVVFGEIWLFSRLLSRFQPSEWWLLLIIPILIGSYLGIWFVYSEKFNRLLRDVFRIQ
ncbi:hypothetical protein ACI2UY_22265 [Ralstonia nicotianae]